ncbi:hypothetical protein BKA62DRAFT_688477 [Auriculariales sp. MPI-PUGE-AT-0066]|nr:hypothetical protein BKA62DRAFT_688477 [Auriculariales sp. MPI-PUGE-AT-0066]
MFAASSAVIKTSTAGTVSMARSASNATRTALKTPLATPTGLMSRGPSMSGPHMALSLSRVASKTPTATTTVNMLINLTLNDAAPPTLRAMVQSSKTAAPRSPLSVQMVHVERPDRKSAFAKAAKKSARKQAADFTLVLPTKRVAAAPISIPVVAETPLVLPPPKLRTALVQPRKSSFKKAITKIRNVVRFAELPPKRSAFEIVESMPYGTPTPKAEVQWKSCRDRPPTPYPVSTRGYFDL